MDTMLANDDRRRPWLAVALAGLGVCLMIVAGCQAGPATPGTGSRIGPAAPTATRSAAPATPAAAPPQEADPAAAEIVTLTLWSSVAFSPTQAITPGQVLAGEFAAFESRHPGVRIQVLLKEPYGAGGLLDFLLKTGPVVPHLLPDVIVLDVNELGAAVEAGRLQALDGLLPGELVADLYPFAREAATFDGRLYALQFEADLDHLVYDTGKISVPPQSWPGVLSNPGPYLYPAGGEAGLANDSLLAQYLAVRRQTGIGDDKPFADPATLGTVLQFYYDALTRGIVPATIAGYHTTDDYWNEVVSGGAALAQMSAHRYLNDRARLPGVAVAALPGMHGPAAPISRGWALALVTEDPSRQAAAVELLAQLMSPAANATWNRAGATLPTRMSALPIWQPDDAYGRFIDEQLRAAHPRPKLPNYTQVSAALQQAVEAVLSGSASPEQAAAQAFSPQ